MRNMPVVQALKNYKEKDMAPFSMPGNKQGRGFSEDLRTLIAFGDITEVDGMDNLHKPQGVLKRAQELLASYYGSRKAYFLVNGSTSGNLTMIFSSFKEGDKILVERSCHKSIFNGIILRKLEPVYIENKFSKEYGLPLGITLENLKNLLEAEDNIKGVVLTYPNYYGICSDIKGIIEYLKERGILSLIDSAHGAHFSATQSLPYSAVELGADMVVMSAHKTLPSLTQGAYLHVNKEELIEETERYLYMFSSTSPSYPIMASLDYARAYLQERGREDYENLILRLRNLKERIDATELFTIIDRRNLQSKEEYQEFTIDESRIIIHINHPEGSSSKLSEYLFKRGVQCEMAEGKNVVLIPGPFNRSEDYERLIVALEACTIQDIKGVEAEPLYHRILKRVYLPYEALDRKGSYVKISEALGRVCTENIIPYPPGIPLALMGEEIDKAVIDAINYYIYNKATILGIYEDKIKVL